MKYIFNKIVREILKEFTKKKSKRVSLSTKVVNFGIMIFPITFLLSLICSNSAAPAFISFLGKVFCFLPLTLTIFALSKTDYLVKKEAYIEKLALKSFYNFLESMGITDEILIDILKKKFFRRYVYEVLKTKVKFYSYKDIRNFCLDSRSYGYFLYVDICRYIENIEKEATFNSRTHKYEKRALTPYENAMKYFSLVKGFSKEELKKAYRRKLKEVHPDSGGTQEEFLKTQNLFEVLNR